MLFGLLTLFTALSIAGVAAWFSIAGLVAIFSASPLQVAIMAGCLEVGKLVAASWLYRNWQSAGIIIKLYLTVAVVVLMLITSMGIFGYLSKAHLDQNLSIGNNQLLISQLEQQIAAEERVIADANSVIEQLDNTVNVLINHDRIRGPDGAIAVRTNQLAERQSLANTISEATNNITQLKQNLLPLQQEELAVSTKVGPLKYVSELIYGDSAEGQLDKAVRLFILMLVFVFDPLAIMLVIAANSTLRQLNAGHMPAVMSKKKN